MKRAFNMKLKANTFQAYNFIIKNVTASIIIFQALLKAITLTMTFGILVLLNLYGL